MKRLRSLALLTAMLASFAFVTAAGAAAPTSRQATVGTLLSGLINANVQNIAVNVGDITVTDVVDVSNVLNDNKVDILKNVLNNSPIASNNSDILTNLLRGANLITDNQIVVGVLGGTFFVTNLVP
jgi:hypothetical protein